MAIDWRDSKHPARLEYEASVKAEFGEQPKRINSPRSAWTASLVAGGDEPHFVLHAPLTCSTS